MTQKSRKIITKIFFYTFCFYLKINFPLKFEVTHIKYHCNDDDDDDDGDDGDEDEY